MSRIITPPLRASYVKIVEGEVNEHGKTVYSLALLIEDTPEGREFLKKAEAAADEVGRAKFGAKYDAMKKAPTFKYAVRYDVDKYEGQGDKGDVIAYINARSYDTRPGVVSRFKAPGADKPADLDPSAVYSGCYVKASITPFAKDLDKNKSVSFSLNNLQFWDEGPRLDGRVKASDEFQAEEGGEADLDDL